MRLGLGTAQLGLDYGVTNRRGQPTAAEAARLLGTADACGVELLDTAPAYGSAEQVVGAAIGAGHRFQVVTKTAPGTPTRAALRATFHASLERLVVPRAYGLLLHRCGDALAPGGGALLEEMQALKRAGLTERVGVSVYDASELDAVLGLFTPDIVQLPLSALDQRMARSGHLAKLAALGVEIHARSVFLQGTMLEPAGNLPVWLEPLRAKLASFHASLREAGYTPLQGALGYVAQQPEVALAIVGVTAPAELEQIAAAARQPVRFDFTRFAAEDVAALNPATWQSA